MGSFVWHVREGSLDGPEIASAYRYHPFSVDEPHIGTDDVFLEGAGPWRVIDFQRTDLLESMATSSSSSAPARSEMIQEG